MVAIVAIPSDDQGVRNLSSEKVPHLTLLFLGEKAVPLANVEAAISTFHKFFLPVKSRGILGDKSADVLFFDTNSWQSEYVEKLRARLLIDPVIKETYRSIEQFPKWVPHLTLGYPESPAKRDAEQAYPAPGVLSVEFDRIALWTGNYEGVEFPLNDNELSMSDRGREYLEHFGVKGMKWGVIRFPDGSSRNAKPSEFAKAASKDVGKAGLKIARAAYNPSDDAKKAKVYMTRAKVGGVRNLNNKEMRLVIERMELEQRYKDLYGERQFHDEGVAVAKRLSKKGARWAGRLFTDILRDGASSWIKRPGSNASGQTSTRARAWVGNQSVINGSFSPAAIGS